MPCVAFACDKTEQMVTVKIKIHKWDYTSAIWFSSDVASLTDKLSKCIIVHLCTTQADCQMVKNREIKKVHLKQDIGDCVLVL